jgi:hypothetical protein
VGWTGEWGSSKWTDELFVRVGEDGTIGESAGARWVCGLDGSTAAGSALKSAAVGSRVLSSMSVVMIRGGAGVDMVAEGCRGGLGESPVAKKSEWAELSFLPWGMYS